MLRDGWKSVGKIFVIAIVIDLVEQFIVLRWFYPGEALLVAFILACIPYLLIRGVVNRIARGNGAAHQATKDREDESRKHEPMQYQERRDYWDGGPHMRKP